MKEGEIYNCPACGVEHDAEVGLKASWYPARPADVGEDHPAFKLCWSCMRVAANAYGISVGYEPVTWPRPRYERRGNVKEVIPEDLRWRVFERDGFKCKHCGSRQMLRADHVHPESAGGAMTEDNLQTLCNRCNSKKGKKVAA